MSDNVLRVTWGGRILKKGTTKEQEERFAKLLEERDKERREQQGDQSDPSENVERAPKPSLQDMIDQFKQRHHPVTMNPQPGDPTFDSTTLKSRHHLRDNTRGIGDNDSTINMSERRPVQRAYEQRESRKQLSTFADPETTDSLDDLPSTHQHVAHQNAQREGAKVHAQPQEQDRKVKSLYASEELVARPETSNDVRPRRTE